MVILVWLLHLSHYRDLIQWSCRLIYMSLTGDDYYDWHYRLLLLLTMMINYYYCYHHHIITTKINYYWPWMTMNDYYHYYYLSLLSLLLLFPTSILLMAFFNIFGTIFPGSDSWSALCRWQPLLAPAAPVDRGPQVAFWVQLSMGKTWENHGKVMINLHKTIENDDKPLQLEGQLAVSQRHLYPIRGLHQYCGKGLTGYQSTWSGTDLFTISGTNWKQATISRSRLQW